MNEKYRIVETGPALNRTFRIEQYSDHGHIHGESGDWIGVGFGPNFSTLGDARAWIQDRIHRPPDVIHDYP